MINEELELVLGESVEDNSCLVDIVGANIVDVDCVIDVERVNGEMTVVEISVTIELVVGVVEEGAIVVGRIAVDVISVDAGSVTVVDDGNGVSQILYSQSNAYELALITRTYNNISV